MPPAETYQKLATSTGNSARIWFYKSVSSGLVPPRVLGFPVPDAHHTRPIATPQRLEIVSHCWGYSHFLGYQLASLARHPPATVDVTMTVFYSTEDSETARLLDSFRRRTIERVHWQFVALPKESLFRRSIGRNQAARSSAADLIWFTDCDVLFYAGCLDGLAGAVAGQPGPLFYPRHVLYSPFLPSTDPLMVAGRRVSELLELPAVDNFSRFECSKAMGPIQIVVGDVARRHGYCNGIPAFQKPVSHWAKAHEDRVFRWLMGTSGVAVDVPHVVILRHREKGRYKRGSIWSALRTLNRSLKEGT